MSLQVTQTPSGQVEFTIEEFNAALDENVALFSDALRTAIRAEVEATPKALQPRVRWILANVWNRTREGME